MKSKRIYRKSDGKVSLLCSGDIPDGYSEIPPKKVEFMPEKPSLKEESKPLSNEES